MQRFTGPTLTSLALLGAALVLLTALPLVAEGTLAQGTWTEKSFAIKGQWQIIQEGDQLFVVLDDSFKTKKAPDLKIFLSPLSVDAVGNANATEGSLLVAPLPSHRGAQRLAVPAGVDLSAYRSILLHCEKYTKLWGAGDLHP